MKQIYISDFTLSKLATDRKKALLFREKTAIAVAIDSFGIDAVELAPVSANKKEDGIIYKSISSAVKNAAVCLPVGYTVEDVETAWNCISEAVSPCLQVVLPVSTVQMEYTYHIKANKMLLKIEELCKAAKEKCERVEFVALDATRADGDFLLNAIDTAVKNGAVSVTISDDSGMILPDEFALLIKSVKEAVSVPVYVHVSDKMNMAVASAVAAIKAGADGVKAVITGKNELREDKFIYVIENRGQALDICTNAETTKIHSEVRIMSQKLEASDTIVAETFENKENIFLDSECSLDKVADASAVLGYSLSAEDTSKVQKAIQRVCKKKSSIGAKELEALIAANAMQVPSTYHLENYSVVCSNVNGAMSSVSLIGGSDTYLGVATGDGPIDAAFKAIEQSIGAHYELDEFQIQAVTEGKEALGSALVRLRSNGVVYSGNGLSTDIVAASIRAYINALNKIVYEEN